MAAMVMSMTVRLNPMTNSPAYSTLAGSSACASTQQAETAQRSIVAIKRARWDIQERLSPIAPAWNPGYGHNQLLKSILNGSAQVMDRS
jgi:hypothetical protein